MSIDQIFDKFNDITVLIVGDVMIDRYLEGAVNRISPEAPVPVVSLKKEEQRLGGAANVALNIKALGATPILCSVVGKDKAAEKFFELLPEHQLSARGIIQSNHRQTTSKTRILSQNQQLIRLDREDTHPLVEEEASALISRILEILEQKDIDVILFQDYNKGVLSNQVIRSIILEAIKKDIPTGVDPKHQNFWSYKHINLFKPNLREIRDQVDFEVDPNLESLQKAAKVVHHKLGNQYTLITLSEKGVFLDDNQSGNIYPTIPRRIADVCGAGDTVFSVAGLGLAFPEMIQEMAQLANLAGSQVCEYVGVVPVNKEQLKSEFEKLKTQTNP